VNAEEALDDYLLGLLAEAVPALAGPHIVGAASAATADSPATAESIGAEAPPTPTFDPALIAADLLAEMDADPAFAAMPAPVGAASAATADSPATAESIGAEAPPTPTFDPALIAADLLAEMDADPAFAAMPAPVGAASAATAGMAKVAAEAAPTTADFTADLLAEMDADPAFAAPAPATPRPAAPQIGPVARRTPPRAARLPAHIQAMFQATPVVPDAHRRAADRSTRWLRLRCGEQTYALELLKVQEVVLPVPLLPLRGAARSMLGIMNLRGQVVPVMDLGVHLGAAPIASDAHTRVVVLEENGETMGLRVSAVEDVTSLTDQHIEPPDNTRLCRISNHLFRGVARLGAQPMILLDARELLH